MKYSKRMKALRAIKRDLMGQPPSQVRETRLAAVLGEIQDMRESLRTPRKDRK